VALSMRLLRHFVATAECGGLTAASAALHVSQPSLSASIAELESLVNAQLFIRHPGRGLALTVAGDRFLVQVRNLLAHVAEVERFGASLGQAEAGMLRVGCFQTLAPFLMPRLLADFATEFPAINLRHEEGHQEELLEKVRAGQIDLALTYMYGLSEEFSTDLLAELPPRLVVSIEHRFARRKCVSLREIASDPMVLLDLPITRDYFIGLFRSVNLEPHVVHRTRSYEMVRAYVGRGLGFSILNAMPALPTYDGSKLVALRIEENMPKTLIVAVRSKRVTARPSVERFREYLERYFANGAISLMPVQTRNQ